MKSIVSPSYFKQQAKRLKKEKALSHSESLDVYAQQCGFSNYRHYLNQLDASRDLDTDAQIQKLFSESEIAKRADLFAQHIKKFGAPTPVTFKMLRSFAGSNDAVQTVCENSILKQATQKFMSNYFRSSEVCEEIQRFPKKRFFASKEIKLGNLKYEMNEKLLHISGKFDLQVKCILDIPLEDQVPSKNMNPEPMFGDFEVTLDEDGSMTCTDYNIQEIVNGIVSRSTVDHGRIAR